MTQEQARSVVSQFLSVADVAEAVGKSRQAVEKAIRGGKLLAVEWSGQRWVHREWLARYLGQEVADSQPEEPQEPPQVALVQPAPIYKVAPAQPALGRTAPPALANPKVQPRPKSSWLPKKERGRVEEGRV